MKKGRCCFFTCCCCSVLVLMVLVALAVGGFFVIQKGMEVPPGYTKSTVPLNEAKGKELWAQIEKGGQEGHLELSLSKQDLRNLIAAKVNEAFQAKAGPKDKWAASVADVQVDFGSTTDLPAAALPRAYPVRLDKSVRLDLIVPLNIGRQAEEPFVLYPLAKVLAGAIDCNIYWSLVDVGLGGYSMLELMKWAEKAGGKVEGSRTQVEKVSLPAGACATELSQDQDNLRIVFGPEGGSAPKPTPAPH
jgi:hypothetical protein